MSEATDLPPAKDGLPVLAICIAAFSLVAAVVGVGLGLRAIDESGAGASSAEASSAPVSLTEFAITPASVAAGGSLRVTNDGSVAHDLAVEGTDLATPQLDAGESADLALDGLEPGSYTLICTISGHRDAGMEATLEVTEGGAGTAVAAGDHAAMGHGSGDMDYAAMTQSMVDSMALFPAETEGAGNEPLEPSEVLDDGTLVFELTAEIVDWERAPGDVVQAWTYNGMVPGPRIDLEIGDEVELRLTNELPIATDLHLHGLNIANEFDGVAPITQDPIEPGETFTYEYTADEVAVAMYHPHFHSQIGMPNGMFGTILVGQVPIPEGQVADEVIPAGVEISQELPMVVNDSGVIGYSLNGKSFPATAPVVAQTGDWVLFHYYNEGNQVHPMHLHAFDQIVVAKDGFPLDSPYVADVVNVAPGERYSVLVELDEPGTWVWHCHILPHVEDDEGMFGMVTAVVVE